MTNPACQGNFGRWFGHNYKPVFEKHPPQRINLESGRPETVLRVIREMTTTRYVHSCCTRCGELIKEGEYARKDYE